jgi:hypothetical protein
LAVVCISDEEIGDGWDDVEKKDGKYLRGGFGGPCVEAYCDE